MVIKNGCYGMFIGCIGYLDCYYIVYDEEFDDVLVLLVCLKCKKG